MEGNLPPLKISSEFTQINSPLLHPATQHNPLQKLRCSIKMELGLMPECGNIVLVLLLSGHSKSPEDEGGILAQEYPVLNKTIVLAK